MTFLALSHRWSVVGVASLLTLLVLVEPAAAAPGGKATDAPDFTQGDPLPEDLQTDWQLGATGASGYIHSVRMSTAQTRQVYITRVEDGSPADGVLREGDVLLGIGEGLFNKDPRVQVGEAITQAESPAGRGVLPVIRWRSGATQRVAVRLPVLGTYSPITPFSCAKSRRVLEQGCAWLAEQMRDEQNYQKRNPTERSLNALALLASGDEQYLPLVKREAQWAAGFENRGFQTWWYGYTLMLLSEYVMATGDRSVMPGLERQAMAAVLGQSDVGSWGHRFANPDGRLAGYGMMNAPGLTLTIGLVLAREAGVDDPRLTVAIQRSVELLRFYVGKGSIPYGDHDPWIENHDDNGKNSAAAVLFNLLGDREAAEYFSRMALACHGAERDTGHTGNFWNILWALPGVAQSGPHATGAWMAEYGESYFDSARTHEGNFVHQGPPDLKRDSYARWDCTGAYLLAYALGQREIRLTGKGPAAAPKLSRDQAEAIIKDGYGWDNNDRNSYYDAFSEAQLMHRLESWSPVVRRRAAEALGRRKAEVFPQVLAKLKSDDLHTKYGAARAIKFMRGDRTPAIPVLLELLNHDDLWLRILSAEALQGMGDQARDAVPILLRRLAEGSDPTDPRGMEQRYLCDVLFAGRGGMLGRSLEGIDHDLLMDAIRAGLQNEDGRARGNVASIYRHLTLDQLRPLLPAIHEAIVEPAPSGIMFASQVRVEGLRVLARHHVKQGIPAAVAFCRNQNPWASENRVPEIMEILLQYGAHAQAVIPQLEALADDYADGEPDFPRRLSKQKEASVRETIEKIKASDKRPELIDMDGPGDGEVG